MFAKRKKELIERKREIVVETGLYRNLIELECASLRVRFDSARAGVRPGSPWLKIVGTIAGFLAAQRWFGLMRWLQRFKSEH